jgi:hypothetical protein
MRDVMTLQAEMIYIEALVIKYITMSQTLRHVIVESHLLEIKVTDFVFLPGPEFGPAYTNFH